MRRVLAWGVHAFTASGAVAGLLALLAIDRAAWRAAALWMLAALVIDALDGMAARQLDVARLTPRFDGRRLDDVVDYLNYAVVPAVFLAAGPWLPHWAFALPPLLASAYGFGQVEAKTGDDFFLGFPSYWNVVALYALLLDLRPAFTAALLCGLSLLVFVPWRYAYPSRLRAWRCTTFALMLGAGAAVAGALLFPARGRAWHLAELSLLFPAWYLWLSWRLGGLHRRGRDGTLPRP